MLSQKKNGDGRDRYPIVALFDEGRKLEYRKTAMLLTPTFSCRMIVITKGGGRQDCFGIRPLRSPLFYLIFNSALCIFDKFFD